MFISCHLTRNEPKKQTKDGRTYGSPPWIHHSLVCARRTAERCSKGAGSWLFAGPCGPAKGWSQPRRSGSVANLFWRTRGGEKLCLRLADSAGLMLTGDHPPRWRLRDGSRLLGPYLFQNAAFLQASPQPSRRHERPCRVFGVEVTPVSPVGIRECGTLPRLRPSHRHERPCRVFGAR